MFLYGRKTEKSIKLTHIQTQIPPQKWNIDATGITCLIGSALVNDGNGEQRERILTTVAIGEMVPRNLNHQFTVGEAF